MTGSMCVHRHPGGKLVCPFCPGVEVQGRECPCCGTSWGRDEERPWVCYGPGIVSVEVDSTKAEVVELGAFFS